MPRVGAVHTITEFHRSKAGDLKAARRQIAELERKVGQQALDLDFFKGALRRIETSRRTDTGPGAPVSSPRSRR